MAEPVTVTISAATVVLIAERLYAYMLAPKLRTKAEEQARQGDTAGGKDPSFWQKDYRDAVDERLEKRVLPIMENQNSILESLARTMESVAVLVKELVDANRRRRR